LCQACYKKGVHSELCHPFQSLTKTATGTVVVAIAAPMSTQPVPIITSTPQAHYGKYISSNFDDGQEIPLHSRVIKTFVIENTGEKPWPSGTTLSYTRGDLFGPNKVDVAARAGEQVTIELPLNVSTTGRMLAYYRLTTPDGQQFGPSLWVDIIGKHPEEAQPKPVAIPDPQPSVPSVLQIPEAATVTLGVLEPSTPEFPWLAAVHALREMGFADDAVSRRLLTENNGDLTATVQELLKIM